MTLLSIVFSISLLLSAFFVISSRNPVHSVMFLVLVFLFSAGILFCLEVEFLALSFIIVYVGAIAVLFLFVVMMLDIKIGDNTIGYLNYGPIAYFITFLFLLEITIPLIKGVTAFPYASSGTEYTYINWFNQIDFITNLESMGQLLYTYYFVFFLMSGFILFVAMLGAIMLTLSLKKSVKKQIVYKQLSRHEENAYVNQRN
jgi:NADH-quinone oxidoreductase subunit J